MRSGTGSSPSTGYPTELPLTDCGAVAENQWAFMPVYAYLAKLARAAVRRQWGAARSLDLARRRVPGMPRAVPHRCAMRHGRRRGDVGGRLLRLRRRWRRCSRSATPSRCSCCGCSSSLWCVHAPPVRLAVPADPADGASPGPGCSPSRCSWGCSASGAGSRAAASRSPAREIVHIVALGAAGRRRPGSRGRSSPASSPATRAPTSRPSSPGGATGCAARVPASSRSTASCSGAGVLVRVAGGSAR